MSNLGVVVSKGGSLRDEGFTEIPEYWESGPEGLVIVTVQKEFPPIALEGTEICKEVLLKRIIIRRRIN